MCRGGPPPEATVITGFGDDPVPTSSLLAFWCAGALTNVEDLLWLAAVGLVGDLGDKAPFPELAEARKRCTATALRELVSLVNAPRRAAAGEAASALALLLAADGPKEALSGQHRELDDLRAAREEVKAAVEAGKRVAPRVRGDVALILLDSPCQIHPLVAQAWRLRLKDKLVIAANRGFRPGWVHFALRSATGRDLIAFLREQAPPGADENYGGGTCRRRAARCDRPIGRLFSRVSGSAPTRRWQREGARRLGFPVKVMARPDLKSNDTRRWQANPHLKVSLENIDGILDHLARHDIRMYRMSSDLAPYATHPDMPQFHGMVAESDAELRAIGAKAKALDIRLSFHPSQFVVLNSPTPSSCGKACGTSSAKPRCSTGWSSAPRP